MHPILGIVGPSGSGKTSLTLEMLKRFPERLGIAKSLTTRAPRNEEDRLFYDFVDVKDIDALEKEGRLTHRVLFADTHYATDHGHLDELLSARIGICALVQDGVRKLRAVGYDVKVVRIIPEGQPQNRDATRIAADHARMKDQLPSDVTILNRFELGGFDHAADDLAAFIRLIITNS